MRKSKVGGDEQFHGCREMLIQRFKVAETHAAERGRMHSSTPSVLRRDLSTKNSGITFLGRLKIIRSGTSIIHDEENWMPQSERCEETQQEPLRRSNDRDP